MLNLLSFDKSIEKLSRLVLIIFLDLKRGATFKKILENNILLIFNPSNFPIKKKNILRALLLNI